MKPFDQLYKVFELSDQIPFNDSSKIVIMSDCHRGDGNWTDNFSRNQNIYFNALTRYLKSNYTYIELGDGDELWECKDFSSIRREHSDVFWLLSEFYNQGRLFLLFGNHDMVKKSEAFVKKSLYNYTDERGGDSLPLFNNIRIHEGLILVHTDTGNKIYLTHGHQVDFLNNQLWRLSRFLVRYLWRPLELYGIKDPTRTAKNYERKLSVERRLTDWALKGRKLLITGHTHRPIFPEVGEPTYFNDGCSVHPRCITAIEISSGQIKLVKWFVNTREDGTLFIDRAILAGPRNLEEYFKTLK